MGLVHTSATFGPIDPANLAEFKAVGRELMATTKDEPGTLRYDWFFTEDESHCEIREIYTDSAAVFVHMANAAEALGRLAPLGGNLTLTAYGDVSPELRQAFDAFGTRYHPEFQSK